MKTNHSQALKRNTFLFLAIMLLFSDTNLTAQLTLPDSTQRKINKQKHDDAMANTQLIFRGDFVKGRSVNLQTLLPEEKPYCNNGRYMVPKKVRINAVLRGDTSLLGKIITIPFDIGRCYDGELMHSAHSGAPYYYFDSNYDEYYFVDKNDNDEYKINLIGAYRYDYKKYTFNYFTVDEKMLFEEIIKTNNYNPKFMLEAGMKIPEQKKKDVGFLVKETEEPANKSMMVTTDAYVKFTNFQNTNSNQYLGVRYSSKIKHCQYLYSTIKI